MPNQIHSIEKRLSLSPMLPSEFPEVQPYPNLKQLLKAQVDMQFEDLRTILSLPRESESGCNFTAAAILLNLASGFSVFFYKPSKEALLNRGDRSERFKGLLNRFYPLTDESIPADRFVTVLYEYARNPLVHSLGLNASHHGDSSEKIIWLIKWSLSDAKIFELEDSLTRPVWAPPTLCEQILPNGKTKVLICIPTICWGIHRMLHSLLADSAHASPADSLEKTFGSLWVKYVTEDKLRTPQA